MSPTNVDTEIKAREREKEAARAAEKRERAKVAAESTQETLDLQLSQSSFHNPPSHTSMMGGSIAFDLSWDILKETRTHVNHCSEKGCFAHAKRVAPEDGKPYCDICVSQHMKEPKPEKPEDKAKKVGVR